MGATDALEQAVAAAAERGVAAALATLIDRLDHIDDPRPAVWTPKEAGIVLGASEDIVRRWVREGHLGRLPGTDNVLIPRKAVEAFLEAAS